MPYQHLVVSLSGRKDEERVIHEAVRLSESLGASLTVLHVQDPHAGELSMMMGSEPRITEDDLRKQFRNLGHEAAADALSVSVVVGSSYPKEIAKASEDADLLIVGHRRKNRFLAALSDSTDQHVSDMVRCPVLLIPL